MTHVAVAQGSDAWLAARRQLITATDVPVLLGLSPYRCEADVADEKLHGTQVEPTLRMRVGSAVQDLIGEEYTRKTNRPLRRFRGLVTHPDMEWAGASPDFRVVGDRRLVEAKRSSSRSRFADGLPQDVEAQVAWQLGVTGYPRADVAVLLGDDELEVFEVEADARLFGDLVAIATDFRARLAAGGPFARDSARIKRDHPSDNGAEMLADEELTQAVNALVALRGQRKDMEAAEERIETAIKSRMGDVATLIGQGFRVSWRQTKSRTLTDWRPMAEGLLSTRPDEERAALLSVYTRVEPGFRPFRITNEKAEL